MNTINTVKHDNYNYSFTSRNNPIKTFQIVTKLGDITVEEVNYGRDITPRFIKKLTEFFCRNFGADTIDPFWSKYKTGAPEEKKNLFDMVEKYYTNLFKEEEKHHNTTLLIAKDKNNRMQGACLTTPCYEIPGAENSALYIDSVATNKKYRGFFIAKRMMLKTMEAGSRTFSDSFLTAAKESEGFYEKLGYKKLNKKSPDQRTILKYIAEHRRDYPDYMTPMSIPLDVTAPRWFKKTAKTLNEISEK